MELTPPINPEIKELWCSALESDEYPQATGRLRTDGGFCCLGVLSDLAIKAGVTEWIADPDGGGYEVSSGSSYPIRGTVAREVQSWAGLKGYDPSDPLVEIDNERFRLSALNDRGYDFKTIAQIIREQL